MNIFVTDPSPWQSAVVLPDKHIVKMPLETCQMLSIVCSDKWGHGFGTLPRADGQPYATEKGAFRNHPCTKWANEFVNNWQWLLARSLALCEEYRTAMGGFTPATTPFCSKDILPTADPQGRSGSIQRPLFVLCPMNLNLTQALILLLLTKCTLAANLGLHLIIFVTHPETDWV